MIEYKSREELVYLSDPEYLVIIDRNPRFSDFNGAVLIWKKEYYNHIELGFYDGKPTEKILEETESIYNLRNLGNKK